MGVLTIKGTLDIKQFWADGKSDADTSKILVAVDPAAMVYRKTPGSAAKNVFKVYSAAFSDNKLKKPVVKKGIITVRLQGIDAPELHVRPQSDRKLGSLAKSKNNNVQVSFEYRQNQAETATVHLGDKLKKTSNKQTIPCTFVTQLDHQKGPADAIDKYGRFVGDIFVGNTNLNHWLLEQGLAIVSLYNSLQDTEVSAYLKAWSTGKQKGIAQRYAGTVLQFDPNIVYRDPKKGARPVNEGSKRFILPKLYRRQCTWFAYNKLGKFPQDLQAFLHTKDNVDRFYEIKDFLDNGNAALQKPFSECVKNSKQMTRKPEAVIFKEATSSLYAKQGNQVKRLTSW